MTASSTQEKKGKLLAFSPQHAHQWVLRGSAELQTNGDQSGDLPPKGAGSRHMVAVGRRKPFCPAQLRAVPRTEQPLCQVAAKALLRAAVAGRMFSSQHVPAWSSLPAWDKLA